MGDDEAATDGPTGRAEAPHGDQPDRADEAAGGKARARGQRDELEAGQNQCGNVQGGRQRQNAKDQGGEGSSAAGEKTKQH